MFSSFDCRQLGQAVTCAYTQDTCQEVIRLFVLWRFLHALCVMLIAWPGSHTVPVPDSSRSFPTKESSTLVINHE